MSKLVGIDLGTTNTVVAVMDGPRARVLDSREGKPQIRSVVGLKRKRGKRDEPATEELLVGDAAVDNWGFAPRDTIHSIKRLMGRSVADPEVQNVSEWAQYKVVPPSNGTRDSVRVLLGGKEYSPIDISAMILSKAKEDAEFRLGEPVTHAVITVPAYFSQIQRDATRKAGLKAGLKVIKVLDEPTAAAIAFGTDSGDGTPKTILVYDLGGGTFDVSLLMVAGSIFAPLNLEGDMWLGGDNLDQVLVDYALDHVKDEFDVDGRTDHRFMAELRKAAQAVKERLSASSSAYLVVLSMLKDEDGNLLDVDIEIKRDDYERMIAPLVARYRQCSCGQVNLLRDKRCVKCNEVLRFCDDNPCSCRRCLQVHEGKTIQIVRRTLAEKNYTVDQVDGVLMAGNSTVVPIVQQTIEEIFGRDKVIRKSHPKHSVALGAAIQAVWIGDHIVCHAPSPTDPKEECGHVNEPDATQCASCKAQLGLGEPSEAATVLDSIQIEIGAADAPRPGQVGGIAPMNYGTQSAGDKFNVFINKGDPYPTESPRTLIFSTRVATQRMLSIPIFGGSNLDTASANQKQGQAFTILPAGLPQETPVRVKLWLNRNGVFGLSVYLQNGKDLEPWIVTGEEDARVIEGLQRVEQIIAANVEQVIAGQAVMIAPKDMKELEEGREEIFRKMKKRDFDGALADVIALEKKAEEAATGGTPNLRQMIENAVGYLEFIIHQYSWLISDPNQLYRLNQLIEDCKDDINRGNDVALEQRMQQVEAAIEKLPEDVKVFLTLRGLILAQVQRADPAAAASLLHDLDAVEELHKMNSPAVKAQIEALVRKIQEAIPVRPGGTPCWKCHFKFNVRDIQYCPQCGADNWIPGNALSSSGSFRSA